MDKSNPTELRDTLTPPFIIIDNFLAADTAQTMRTAIDNHFRDPSGHRPESHQVWNYWFVPRLYTYLRTQPEKIIELRVVKHFVDTLRNWSSEALGLSKVTWPYLSLYVNGCGQGLHNDSQNGRFAFVYSLTRIERRTTGGQTVILREGDLFRRFLRKPTAGITFYEAIEPQFNRLVVFDDRLVHGVERIEGSMDPVEGRCVLHGHIEEAGPVIRGSLPIEALRQGLWVAVDRFVARWSAAIQLCHGPLVVRFTILPNGTVIAPQIVIDRVIHEEGSVDWQYLKVTLIEQLSSAVFPTARGETSVMLPLTFGGALNINSAQTSTATVSQ